MKCSQAIAILLYLGLLGCSSSKNLGSTSVDSTCAETNECLFAAKMVTDQFERSNVLVNTSADKDELTFWWRKIINDKGKVIAGSAGNKVDVRIFSQPDMGPGSDDGSALYFFGRQGSSVHNIYLVSQTFDLRAASKVELSFKYLPIDLEANEYLRLEVCRASRDDCGVGDEVSVSGLNSNDWEPLFELNGSAGQGRNGKNHLASDWDTHRLEIDIDSEDLRTFTFRFNVRMNDGFIDNVISKGMDDGVGLDEVKAYAFRVVGSGSKDEEEEIPGTVDPFDPEQSFDSEDPRLFE